MVHSSQITKIGKKGKVNKVYSIESWKIHIILNKVIALQDGIPKKVDRLDK